MKEFGKNWGYKRIFDSYFKDNYYALALYENGTCGDLYFLYFYLKLELLTDF
jgi:hypothetical protein